MWIDELFDDTKKIGWHLSCYLRSMITSIAQGLWLSRAKSRARSQPGQYVGARCSGWSRLPRSGVARDAVSRAIYCHDVPAAGDCLYHAVWAAAIFAGVPMPFGCAATVHVFELRVEVAVEEVGLLEKGDIVDDLDRGSLNVGNLVAEPNQFALCSGAIPILGMAKLLERAIVVLSADGIFLCLSGQFNCSNEKSPSRRDLPL